MKRVVVYTIPTSGGPRTFLVKTRPLAVGVAWEEAINGVYSCAIRFWVEDIDGADAQNRTFQAFLTGDDIPEDAVHVGTVATGLRYIWHLYELQDTSSS